MALLSFMAAGRAYAATGQGDRIQLADRPGPSRVACNIRRDIQIAGSRRLLLAGRFRFCLKQQRRVQPIMAVAGSVLRLAAWMLDALIAGIVFLPVNPVLYGWGSGDEPRTDLFLA